MTTMLTWMRRRFWFVAFCVVAGAWLYAPLRHVVLQVEVTPAQRGAQVAHRAGCFGCHGPDGVGGVKNPGSADEEVPGFAGGTPMMWAKSETELREYILDGAPPRKRNDPRHQAQVDAQLLTMPAYRGHLSGRDVDDLIAYIRAVSGLITPTDPVAARGQDLALRLGCFLCHGPMGAGGTGNPGSLKGYIPGWWGNDFRELVRDEAELRGWILDGGIARLREHPVARYFLARQRVPMPAYRRFVSEHDLEALVRYVQWVNAGEWQGTPLDLGH